MPTRLEVFLRSRGIKPVKLAREVPCSRQYLARVRLGQVEPTRRMIARITSALRRLSLEDVRAEDLFELTVEDSAARAAQDRHILRDAAAYGRSRGAAEALWRAAARRRVESWLPALARHPAGVTEDMVRVLVFDAEKKTDRNAGRALAILTLADAIAERLPNSSAAVVAALRGRIHLDRAYGLRQLGRYREALPLLDEAEEQYERTPHCAHEVATVWYERAAILFVKEDYDAAIRAARRAVNLFTLVGDRRRIAKAQLILACVFHERGELEAALASFTEVESALRAMNDREALASVHLNLGATETLLGNVPAAQAWIEKALRAFSQLGRRGEIARTRWAMARLHLLHFNRAEGMQQHRDVRAAFEGLGMHDDAGTVMLDMAAYLLEDGKSAESASLCREALAAFEHSGAAMSARRAVRFLYQAIQDGAADAALVREVRRFLDRSAAHPEQEFAPKTRTGPA